MLSMLSMTVSYQLLGRRLLLTKEVLADDALG